MLKEELGTPTYTAETVVVQTLANITAQLADLDRERTIIEGKIEALRNIKYNIEYMKNHRG